MKVEAVVLKPMWAGDGNQGIKFDWPSVCMSVATYACMYACIYPSTILHSCINMVTVLLEYIDLLVINT